jgi:hypothetical protein
LGLALFPLASMLHTGVDIPISGVSADTIAYGVQAFCPTGVIAQILVFPPGALAGVPGLLRYGAVAAGLAVFIATRRSIFAGVVCGEVVMLAGKWWLG